MMAYKTTYHEDSDADDEYERSVITSPTLPPDFESSPTDSEPPSTEHTPTTFTHSAGGSHGSPTGLITDWTVDQCADWVSSLGLSQYADTFVDEGITGDALKALHHNELKEMGMTSVGHRLTILKGVYDVKVKQNVKIEPEEYVPLSAEPGAQEAPPTQDDISRIIRIIKDRDERIHSTEVELKALKEDLLRVQEENRKLREEILPLARIAKDRSQPLPTPDSREDGQVISPPLQERAASGLSRKFSTKKLFLGSAPKNTSPTIHEGRTLTDTSNLDPSAAAMAASSNLTASMTGGHSATSPHQIPQPSPTSPAYSSQVAGGSRSFQRGDSSRAYVDEHQTHSTWSSAASTLGDREGRGAPTPVPMSGRQDPPLSGGSQVSTASTAVPPSSSSNPQVEIFKSFRVSIDDPCHKVLPVALKKYNITADWRQYALYIVHGDQERCLGLNERPLILFKQLDKEGRKPMFMLRKHAAPQEGHVNTVGQNTQPAAYGSNTGSLQGGAVQLPGGVL